MDSLRDEIHFIHRYLPRFLIRQRVIENQDIGESLKNAFISSHKETWAVNRYYAAEPLTDKLDSVGFKVEEYKYHANSWLGSLLYFYYAIKTAFTH